MEIIAHRGESQAAPENTLEAFTLAWARGAGGIEGDFHLTRDGEIVCMHDDNAARTGGVHRALAEMSLEEIKSLDVGRWKNEVWRHTRVPTLNEVLATIPSYGKIYIELKCAGDIVERLAKIFNTCGLQRKQLVIISFDPATVIAVRQRLPDHKVYLLRSLKQDETGKVLPDAAGLCHELREVGAHGIDLCAHEFIDHEYVRQVQREGFEFHIWTVNDAETAARFVDFGIDSITSDCAYALRQELKFNNGSGIYG